MIKSQVSSHPVKHKSAEFYHSALQKVISDHFGTSENIPTPFLQFVSDVNRAFWSLESDKNLMQRAYELNADRLIIANESLCMAREELERRVDERTTELVNANRELENEIVTRKQMEKSVLERELEYRNLADKLRLLTSEISTAEERERRRIASELHDSIVQTLVFCKLKIDSIISPLGGSEAEGPIREIFYLLGNGIKDLRSLIFDISPPVLYELGLEPALESLSRRMQVQHGISLVFYDDKNEKPVNHDVKILLYQSVRELLINIVKHSKANSGAIFIKREKGKIVITVEDNGKGFNPSESNNDNKKNCFGLFNIRERLSNFEGKMQIESGQGTGSRVMISVPVIPPESTA